MLFEKKCMSLEISVFSKIVDITLWWSAFLCPGYTPSSLLLFELVSSTSYVTGPKQWNHQTFQPLFPPACLQREHGFVWTWGKSSPQGLGCVRLQDKTCSPHLFQCDESEEGQERSKPVRRSWWIHLLLHGPGANPSGNSVRISYHGVRMPGYLLSNPTILGLRTAPTSCLHFPKQRNAGTGALAVLSVADRGRAAIASATDFKEGKYHLYVLLMGWVWHSQVTNIDSFKIAFWFPQCILLAWCASNLDHLGDCFAWPHVLTKWEICVF